LQRPRRHAAAEPAATCSALAALVSRAVVTVTAAAPAQLRSALLTNAAVAVADIRQRVLRRPYTRTCLRMRTAHHRA